jgi:hypothetical protein
MMNVESSVSRVDEGDRLEHQKPVLEEGEDGYPRDSSAARWFESETVLPRRHPAEIERALHEADHVARSLAT